MRKSVWVGVSLMALLGGCASTGVYEADTVLKETFSVDTNYQAAFRRAGEYVLARPAFALPSACDTALSAPKVSDSILTPPTTP